MKLTMGVWYYKSQVLYQLFDTDRVSLSLSIIVIMVIIFTS